MDTSSTLEILPDEVLLEVCKYLLCSDILYSFMGFNYRMTRMIAQYRQHLSFHKTSLPKFDYLCVNILPQIGSQIRSLVIDCCYSLLQDRLFTKYFSEKMSIIFPHLERISLPAFEHNQLVTFLNTLHDLNHLVEIRLYNLFPIPRLQQPAVTQTLIQANNHRLTTILLDHQSSPLSFSDSDYYINILQLRIKLGEIRDLPFLFAAVPNVQHLDVIVDGENLLLQHFKDTKISPLIHLNHFQLKSVRKTWSLEELVTLFVRLPSVQCLALFLNTSDERMVQGDTILSLLPSTVRQFGYAILHCNLNADDKHNAIISSWPPSHPITYIFDNRYLFIHTVPWYFPCFEIPLLVSRIMSPQTNGTNIYDKHVEAVYMRIDKTNTLKKSLTVLAQCRRVTNICINVEDGYDVVEEQLPVFYLPKFSRLLQISCYGSVPFDLNCFSIILNAAPSLFRLNLVFGHLLRFIEDPQICHILGQRITSLYLFENEPNSSLIAANEENIAVVASALPRLYDLYIEINYLPSSATEISSENILESSPLQNLCVESCQQNDGVIRPMSSESMLLCLLTTFKEHGLLSLGLKGQFLERIKTDPEQWLRTNTVLCEQPFRASFNHKDNDVLIWM